MRAHTDSKCLWSGWQLFQPAVSWRVMKCTNMFFNSRLVFGVPWFIRCRKRGTIGANPAISAHMDDAKTTECETPDESAGWRPSLTKTLVSRRALEAVPFTSLVQAIESFRVPCEPSGDYSRHAELTVSKPSGTVKLSITTDLKTGVSTVDTA